MDYVFGIISKKASLYPRSCRFSYRLLFRGFIVLHFTFRCVIYFELIFVKNIKSVTMFFLSFFAHECPAVQTPFVEETIFASLYCFCSFVKAQLTVFMAVFSGLSIQFH